MCGVYSLASPARAGADGLGYDSGKRAMLERMLGTEFFAGLDAADPTYLTPEGIVGNVDLPPLFLLTSSDDFLEADALALATALSRKGADFELNDRKVGRHESLGHVYPIGMTWLDESQQADKLFENQQLFRQPIVRNGRQATVGYCPEMWEKWE